MFGKKSETTDLTTPEAVKASQKVYDRITSGKCTDAKAELDATHKTNQK
ncbi:hypothetical protein ACFWUZ_20580 [Streptomyces sp. NPDC058646]